MNFLTTGRPRASFTTTACSRSYQHQSPPFVLCSGARVHYPTLRVRTPGRVATRSAPDNVKTELQDLQELTKLDYFQYLEDAGEDLVVVDFYTDWCGPCKLMYPKLQEMADQLKPQGVRFVKFNCNKYNKELGSGLGVRVAPTFFLYKNGSKVAEMAGAHVEKLKKLIDEHM